MQASIAADGSCPRGPVCTAHIASLFAMPGLRREPADRRHSKPTAYAAVGSGNLSLTIYHIRSAPEMSLSMGNETSNRRYTVLKNFNDLYVRVVELLNRPCKTYAYGCHFIRCSRICIFVAQKYVNVVVTCRHTNSSGLYVLLVILKQNSVTQER